MFCRNPWLDDMLQNIGDFFCCGIVGGSVYYTLKGLKNSPKNESLFRALQTVRTNVPRCAASFALYGGVSYVLESSLIHVRQKNDHWNFFLSGVTAAGLINMRQGLLKASRSALIVGSVITVFVGTEKVIDYLKKRVEEESTG